VYERKKKAAARHISFCRAEIAAQKLLDLKASPTSAFCVPGLRNFILLSIASNARTILLDRRKIWHSRRDWISVLIQPLEEALMNCGWQQKRERRASLWTTKLGAGAYFSFDCNFLSTLARRKVGTRSWCQLSFAEI
jgi:hypothetical protein